MTNVIPLQMSKPVALAHIQELAQESVRIVPVGHAVKRMQERNITRKQIEACVRTGYISEGPFLNAHSNWQVTMNGYYAGEELTCVVAIQWSERLLIITVI